MILILTVFEDWRQELGSNYFPGLTAKVSCTGSHLATIQIFKLSTGMEF